MQEALAKLKEEEERQKREEEERIKRLEELEAKRKEEVCFHEVELKSLCSVRYL